MSSSSPEQPAGTADNQPTTTTESGARGGVPDQRATREGTRYQEGDRAEYERPEGRRAGAHEYRDQGEYPPESRRRHLGMAGTMMILSGLLTCFIGIVGIIKGVFFNSVATYPFYYSVRSRGVTLLVIGAVVLVVGVALLLRMQWARHVATVAAVVSAIASFIFIPFYPFWSFIVLAIDVLIIWELTRDDRGRRDEYRGTRRQEDSGRREYVT